MRACLLALAIGCGGSPAPEPERPRPAMPATTSACSTAYRTYEQRWAAARTGELVEVGFDDDSIAEVIRIEVALLPSRADLEKLRELYIAVAVFLPDAPWPLALDAADEAIAECGEEAPHPTS